MTMIRKQFFIDREKSRELQRLAAARGVSEAELIRSGVALVLEQGATATADWRTNFRDVLAKLGKHEALARRIEKNKADQAKRWAKRLDETRKQLRRLG